ncbi:MAG: DMT family transporter [Thiothrix sp.]|nr:DMT family transporter [Thiothrix sp.]HPE59640.1 DMT family transporter [Thiolinea sp.]
MFGIFSIFLASSLWALDTLIRYPLMQAGVPALQIVLFEHVFLVLAMLLYLRRHGGWVLPLQGNRLNIFMVGGFGSAIGTLAFTAAFAYHNPTVVILLQKLQPLVAIFAARWILGERWSRDFGGLALLGITGALIMMGPDLLALTRVETWHGYGDAASAWIGYGLIFLAVTAWGLATVFGKRLLNNGYSNARTLLARFGAALLTLTLLALLLEPTALAVPPVHLGSIALLALLAGILGMSAYYYGLKQVPAHIATLAELFFPVAALAVNYLAFGTTISMPQAGGAILITLAALLARHRAILPQERMETEPLGA